MRDIPLLAVALTVSAYWLRVGAMVVRARRRQHQDVGMIPERPIERAMWFVFVPLVALWCALPWLGLTHDGGRYAVPAFAHDGVVYPAIAKYAGLNKANPTALILSRSAPSPASSRRSAAGAEWVVIGGWTSATTTRH